MRAGFASMNDLVIIQTAQGLCEYVRQQYPDADAQQRGLVIGFDGRHNSRRFARLTAAICIHAGLPVWLYSETVATPFVPFAIAQLNCLAGVMVTASHNPKEDNGYKVYWSNAAQIIGPHDKGIERAILANLEPLASSWDDTVLSQSALLRDPLREQSARYLQQLLAHVPAEQLRVNATSDVRFVYTAMHGVGYEYVRQAFEAARLPAVVAVPEQRDADPEFPTVRFPNPEEGASSLELSMALANREGISVILANDPDADRLACAERDAVTGEWRVFSGNELGALLGWWSWQQFRAVHPEVAPADCVMLCSTVSSMVLRAMAAREGFRFEDTLTGFKWMGNRAVELAAEGKWVVFAFEEAIGFMVSSAVLDKDGVSAAVHLGSLVATLRAGEEQRTLAQKLHELYDAYGFHCTVNSYYICHEADVIERIFERIRRWTGDEGTVRTVANIFLYIVVILNSAKYHPAVSEHALRGSLRRSCCPRPHHRL